MPPELIEEVTIRQPVRYILFRDVTDVLADQRFNFQLKSVFQHGLDFFLPRLLVFEPGIGCDLFGPFDVLIAQLDRDRRGELTTVIVFAAEAHEFCPRYGHPPRFVGKVDRSLLDDAVDVVAPRVIIQKAVDGQFQFVMHSMEQPPYAARGLSTAMGEDAIVGAPELVLIETSPHRIFFNVKDEVCFAFFELDDVGFADRRDRVSSRAHPGTIDLVSAVVKDKVADD